MFDHFRFPYAVIYLYRKRGAVAAIDLAVKTANVHVTRDDAHAWLSYILRSPAYKGYEVHG